MPEENTNIISPGVRKTKEPLPCIAVIACPQGHEHFALGVEVVDEKRSSTKQVNGKTEEYVALGIKLDNCNDAICPECKARNGLVIKWWATFTDAAARADFLNTKAEDCLKPVGTPDPMPA
jgi:hypothetical protein